MIVFVINHMGNVDSGWKCVHSYLTVYKETMLIGTRNLVHLPNPNLSPSNTHFNTNPDFLVPYISTGITVGNSVSILWYSV